MESSYQHGLFAPSYSEAANEAGAAVHPSVSVINETDFEHEYQLFTQEVFQHEYQPLPHQLGLNQNFAQSRAESSLMQFNHLHINQEQDHRFFHQSQQLLFTPVHEQMQIEEKPAAFDLRRLLGLENQSHQYHESKLKRGPSRTCFLPQNDVISGQQRPPELPQRLLPDVPSVDSTCQSGNVCFDDWISQAYRELQTVKEMHFSDLSKMYMKVCYSGLQPSTPEQAAKLGHNKSSIEKMVQFLNIPITELVRFNKDKFYYSLYTVIKCVHTYKNRGPVPVQVYAQSFSQLPSLQRWLESKLQSQSAKPGSSGNTGSPQSQKGTKTLPLNKTELNRHVAVAGLDLRNVSSSIRIGSNTTVQPNYTTLSPKLKLNDKNQMRQTQPLKQKNNNEEIKHQMLIQRVNEINEKQQFENSHRSLFPSPWINVSSREKVPFLEGSPSKSVTSPSVTASLSSPAIPSPSPVCLEKISSPISSFTVKDNTEQPQTPEVKSAEDSQPLAAGESSGFSQRYVGVTLSLIENQLLTLGAPEKSDSPSPDLIVPIENQMISDKVVSTKCLNEMIGSISQKALTASVQDIMSVFTLIDTLSGEMVTSESLKTVCEDLASDTFYHSQRSSLLCKINTLNMRKRNISTSGSCLLSSCNENDSDGCASRQTLNLAFSAKSSKKRQRSEGPFNDALVEEIKQINQSLIETVVDVASGFKEDVVVRFSYSAVGLHNLNQRNSSFTKSPILFVGLLLPEDYPMSSPRVLDTSCGEAGESEDIMKRAKLMFSLLLRKLSEPFSLKDMARTWDCCARSVFSEFAQSFGGGSVSSMYGSWESCTATA